MFELTKLLQHNLGVINSIHTAFRREPMDTRRLEVAQNNAQAQLRSISEYFCQAMAKEAVLEAGTALEDTPKSQAITLEASNELDAPSKMPEDGNIG
jgi:hypothetical protein